MKFEYKRVEYKYGDKFLPTLQKLGLEGWELVQIIHYDDPDLSYVAYLKRQQQEK